MTYRDSDNLKWEKEGLVTWQVTVRKHDLRE